MLKGSVCFLRRIGSQLMNIHWWWIWGGNTRTFHCDFIQPSQHAMNHFLLSPWSGEVATKSYTTQLMQINAIKRNSQIPPSFFLLSCCYEIFGWRLIFIFLLSFMDAIPLSFISSYPTTSSPSCRYLVNLRHESLFFWKLEISSTQKEEPLVLLERGGAEC